MRYVPIVSSIVLLLASLDAFAAGKVAVLPLKATHGVPETLAELVTDTFAHAVQERSGLAIITYKDLDNLLGFERKQAKVNVEVAQRLGRDVCLTDTNCLAEISGALGVDFIVSGSLGKLGKTLIFSAELLDVRKAVVKARYQERMKSEEPESFLEAVDGAAAKLFPRLEDVKQNAELADADLKADVKADKGTRNEQREATRRPVASRATLDEVTMRASEEPGQTSAKSDPVPLVAETRAPEVETPAAALPTSSREEQVRENARQAHLELDGRQREPRHSRDMPRREAVREPTDVARVEPATPSSSSTVKLEPAATAVDVVQPEDTRPRFWRNTGVALLVGGLAAGAGSGLFAFLGAGQDDKIKGGGFATLEQIEAKAATGRTYNAVSIATGIAGALLVAGSIPLLVLELDEEADSQIALAPGGVSLAVSFR